MARRRINGRGIRLITRFEGLRLVAYKAHPSEQYWTIGYGHYGPDVRPGMRITPAKALRLLKGDLKTAERAVQRAVDVPINDNRFAALVSFVFNVGVGAFQGSTLLRLLNRRRYGTVPDQLMRWVKAGGVTLPGLVRRRRAEGRLWRRRH